MEVEEEEDVTSTQVNRTAKKTVDAMDQAVLKRKVISKLYITQLPQLFNLVCFYSNLPA